MSDGFEWLDWLEPSGPFVAAPVLKRAFPQGLDTLDPNKRRALRQAYDEYRQALDDEDPEAGKFQIAWIDLVLRQGLEYDEDESGDNLKSSVDLPAGLISQIAEHGVALKPDYAVVDDQNADKPMLLIQVYGQDVDLNDAVRGDGWASSPRERMVRLCRDTGTRLGLVTNGEHWLFVDAPIGAVSSFASWYARLLGPEPVLLQAFVALLGIRRFFVADDEQLPALIDKSVEYQDEVTEALGEQVRRAVEVLIQALDKADVDRNRELLKDVDPRELYEAGLTVMMRLVFLLSAEERELLLLGDERYEANYAVSTLRMQLRGEDDAILQRRWDAWSRLLAIFRAIYGGIEHETLRMPALGGSLFDPDRFPFLEGRDKGSSWKTDPATPLPIDNQTVLLLLDAIQLFEGRTLSYRGLDIEQLGYVYEGLLDHTVKRAKEVTLELDATKSAKKPWVTLGELESARRDGAEATEELLKERTGSSITRVRNDLKKDVKSQQLISLLTACHNNQALHDQLKQYYHLIRTDSWMRPLVYPEGSFMVTTGEDRRQTGSHYTPTSLTEAIVRETLERVVFLGPAEGKPREEWQLKTPQELLELKICDPAMGSGAFLVQVCRWLSERVVESWSVAQGDGKYVNEQGVVVERIGDSEPLSEEQEERLVVARRLIAEQCLYGVDLNPLAVELAKLSIWLVTLAKGRPFGFLDHNLKTGDSLLGILKLEQLTLLSLKSVDARQERLFGQSIHQAVEEAIKIRKRLRETPIRDIRDVETMAELDEEARKKVELPEQIANSLLGTILRVHDSDVIEAELAVLANQADLAIQGDTEACIAIGRPELQVLYVGAPNSPGRLPFHWPLEFPEVFKDSNYGFDAIVFNPPFRSGSRISSDISKDYLGAIKYEFESGANTDLCCYFINRATRLCRKGSGYVGSLATNSISEGDSRTSLLSPLLESGWTIAAAATDISWPGAANLFVSWIVVTPQSLPLGLAKLNGTPETLINSSLSAQQVVGEPLVLKENAGLSFKGVEFLGDGFKLSVDEGKQLYERFGPVGVVKRWLNGSDLTDGPQLPSRFAIDFANMSEEEAREYAECFAIVEKLVKPIRANETRAARRERWWQFGEKAVGMRKALKPLSRALVRPFTSDTFFFEFLSTDYLFTNALVVVAMDDFCTFSLLNSSVHEVWSRYYGSSMKTDFRYTPSKCFQTFPFPRDCSGLEEIGKRYYTLRRRILDASGNGMTSFYNRYNDSSECATDLKEIRNLHGELDEAVFEAYGWVDSKFAADKNRHGFYPTKKGERWTIGEELKLEIMQRLMSLNHERYREIVSQHRSKSGLRKRRARDASKVNGAKTEQSEFEFDESKP